MVTVDVSSTQNPAYRIAHRLTHLTRCVFSGQLFDVEMSGVVETNK